MQARYVHLLRRFLFDGLPLSRLLDLDIAGDGGHDTLKLIRTVAVIGELFDAVLVKGHLIVRYHLLNRLHVDLTWILAPIGDGMILLLL